MGNLLLTTCLPLLQYCPSPQRNASEIQYPNYSLWYLEPCARHSWLMSVLTFIYKYRYSSLPLSRQVQGLIRIVLSTLDAQDHKCHHLPDGCLLTTPNTSRSRDLSNILPGDLQHGPERESPPHSPGLAMDSSRVTVSYQAEAKVVYQKTDTQEETESVTFDDIYSTEPTKPTDRSDWGQPWKPRKLPDYSFSEDVDDAEPELEAIPESPKSENSVPDSLQGSLGELATFQEATVEKARVRVETGISPGEEGVLVVNPPLEQAVKAVTSPLAAGPVESQMAHQLEAFHESFDRGRRVEVGELMTATVTVVQAEPFSPRVCQMEHVGSAEPATVSMSHQEMVLSSTVVTHLSPVPTSAGNNLNVITKRPPLKTARSFSYESKSMHSDVKDKPKIAGNGTDVTLLCPTDVSLEKSPSLVEPKVKAKAKLQRSRTLDSSSLPVSTGKPEPSKKLEVLDARQLEQSIRRREPAVISQCEQQLPQQPLTQSQYVFQPIQSHPITGRPESNDKQRPEYKSSHPIKVEPRRSPGIDGKDPTTSPTPTFSPTLPWTIEVHSAIKLEPLPPVSKPERLIAASQTMKTPEKVEPTSSRRRINRMGSLARTDSLTVDMGDSHEFHKTTPDTSAKASIGADESQQAPHGVTPSEFQFDLPSSERSSAVGYGSRDTEITGQTVRSFHQWTPKLDKQTEEHADSLKEVTITVAQSDVTSGTDNVLFSKCDSLIPVSLQLLPTVGKSLPNQGAVTGILDTLRVERVPVIPAQVHIQMHVAHGDSSTASTSLQRVSCGPSVAVRQYNLGGRSPYPGRSLTRVTSIPEEMTIPHEVYVPSTPGLIPASHLTVAKLTVEEETYHLPPTKLVVGEATSIQAPKGQSQLAIPAKTHLQPDTSLQLQKKSTGSCLGDQPRFMQRSMSVDIPDTHLLPPVEEEPKTATRNQRTEAGAPLMSPLPPSAKSPAKGFSSFHSLSDPGGPHAFHRVDTSAPASHRQLGGFITADHRPPPAKPDSSCSSQMLMQEARPTPGWATEARVIEPKTVHLDEIRPAASVVQVHQARVITAGETVVEEQQFLESFEQEDLRQPSPKRLVKQSHITDTDLQHQSSGSTEAPSMDGPDEEGGSSLSEPQPLMDQEDQKGRPHFRQERQRKLGISSADLQKIIDQRNNVNRKSRKGESIAQPPPKSTVVPPSALRCGEDAVVERCPECGAVLEQYTDEELALCVVILATFVHREPALAAPTLPEILRTVARIASMTMYAWQHETNVYLPGGASSVAKQFLRCVLHQLAPNGIFLQIFQSNIDVDGSFFKTVASALTDFNELNPVAPLQLLLEGLNDSKVLPLENIPQIMENIANYMTCLPLETASSAWTNILPQFDSFFRKLYLILPGQPLDVVSTFKIMASILKIPGLNGFKSILDPFSKMLSFAIQNWNIVYQTLLDICHLCNRAFIKERDKLVLSRTVVFELVQALKFRSSISDDNLLMLVQFVVQDAGGTLGPSMIVEDLVAPVMDVQNMINTNACECMRQHLNDALDFVADVHTLSRVKSNFKGTLMGLNEDTLGATLKAGIAQYLALEITRGDSRDNRTIGRYLPWLYNPPTAVQQGPKEFLDCVAHMRLLSWLLLGALTHTAMLGTNSNLVCQPIPLEASCHVADHIQIILTGFAEQSKASVLHMSSLFHAFILCQLWTMYCEQMASLDPPGSEHHNAASITLTDFWAKITPGILQLLSHSKVLAEMVNLHFLSLMEALLECNSTVLAKLFPMWSPVLNADLCQLPGHLQVRLQACEDWMPPTQTKDELTSNTSTLLKWLQRLQFKMGQIELQSSAATQFYSV